MKIVMILAAAALATSLAVSGDAQAGQKKKCYKISASGVALFSGQQGAADFAHTALALEILTKDLKGEGKVKMNCKDEGLVTCIASQKACK